MPSPPSNSRPNNYKRAAQPVKPGEALGDEDLRQWMQDRRKNVDTAALIGRDKPAADTVKGIYSVSVGEGIEPTVHYCFTCDETCAYALASPAIPPYKLRAVWVRQPCACEREKEERRTSHAQKEAAEAKERREKARIFRNRALSGLMTGKPAKMTFAAWKARGEGVDDAKATVERWVTEFSPLRHRGLTLYSPSRGVGKTHLICAAGHRLLSAGFSVFVTSAADLIETARMEARRETPGNTIEYARSVDYLALDDIGTEGNVTDFVRETLYRIIDHRWKQEKPTLFTTNLLYAQLEQVIGGEMGSRIVSRMSGMATITPLIGLDYRQEEGSE